MQTNAHGQVQRSNGKSNLAITAVTVLLFAVLALLVLVLLASTAQT